MRDFTGAYPDGEMVEVWAVTTSQDRPIVRVQGFKTNSPRVLDCPELNGKLYDGKWFETFERAKARIVRDAESGVQWANERLNRALALEVPAEEHSVASGREHSS